MKVTPEKQRIAIAEFCGWERSDGTTGWWLQSPNHPIKTCGRCGRNAERVGNLPNYLGDLNAIHEAEKLLDDRHKYTDDVRSMYWDYIGLGADGFPDKWEISWHILRATAAQRAEALLRTIGRWEEEKP